MTLACEDGQQLVAHKVILVASSPLFEKILQNGKHPHPLIYLRGFQSKDLVPILDFLYFGEANVYQENLDSFLAIAEELQLKGLQGSNDLKNFNETEMHKDPLPIEPKLRSSPTPMIWGSTEQNEVKRVESNALAIPMLMSADLQQLDETVKSMMETSQNMISDGNFQKRAKICKACGKEGAATTIKRHIEANHLEAVSIPCNHCDKLFRSRNSLRTHVSIFHKQQ